MPQSFVHRVVSFGFLPDYGSRTKYKMTSTDVSAMTEPWPARWRDWQDSQVGSFYNGSNRTSGQDAPFVPCNNPHNLLDKATAAQVERLLHLTLLPSLELFGVITNVINCLVFVRHGLRDRINLCLFSLALADVCFLLLIFSAKG